MSRFDSDFKILRAPFAGRLVLTMVFAAGVSVSAVALLGMSGWFLTAAAMAGTGGIVAIQAFNYLLPSALIRFLAISRTVFRYGERYLGHSAALRIMARLRPALFRRVVGAPPEAALGLSRGEASSHFIQDVTTLENGLVLQSVPVAAMTGMVTALGLSLAGGVAAAAVLGLVMAMTVAGGALIHRLDRGGSSQQAAMSALKSRFHEVVNLLPDIQTCDLAESYLAELTQREDNLRASKGTLVARDAVAAALVTCLTGVALGVMALVSMHATLPGLALALLAGSMGMESAGLWVRSIGQRNDVAVARQSVAGLYDQPQLPLKSAAPFDLPQGLAVDGHLRLRIDGPSGSGKTRWLEHLIGLRGDGLVGASFALCPQDAAILTGTIRDNLMMAFDAKGLTAEYLAAKLADAVDDAGLTPRVAALPSGLDTWIGDGGVTLSGGERKRLCLARAYLRPAEVLVLDEPTEGLDLATEVLVVERLEKRLARTGQGLILVSHREGPRRLANKIHVV